MLKVREYDGRDCLLIGPLRDLRRAVGPLDNAVRRDAAGNNERHQSSHQESAPARCFYGLRGHKSLPGDQAWLGRAVPGGGASASLRSRPCTRLNTVGTRNKVAQVASISPPITARP